MTTAEAHSGTVDLRHSFDQAHAWLSKHGDVRLQTSRGKTFEAKASIAGRGRHVGEPVILFLRERTESARAYSCCWGAYHNCNRTRIGMYCYALDKVM
jgi:hypothetical protein